MPRCGALKRWKDAGCWMLDAGEGLFPASSIQHLFSEESFMSRDDALKRWQLPGAQALQQLHWKD